MILRLLNAQGIAGVAVSLCVALLLVLQKGETRHWRKQAGQFEQLYRTGQAEYAGTVANYRAAAEVARTADAANAARVAAAQGAINERTANDFQARLAAARARARGLRREARAPAADPGRGTATAMPGLPAPAGGTAKAAREARLSSADALTATEQAIQLDELIKWVRQQHAVRVDGAAGERPRAARAQVDPSS